MKKIILTAVICAFASLVAFASPVPAKAVTKPVKTVTKSVKIAPKSAVTKNSTAKSATKK